MFKKMEQNTWIMLFSFLVIGLGAFFALRETVGATSRAVEQLAPAVKENTEGRIKSNMALDQINRNLTALNAWQKGEIEVRGREHAEIRVRMEQMEHDLEKLEDKIEEP